MSTTHKLFQNIEEDRTISNSFFAIRIINIIKLKRDTAIKENYTPLPIINEYTTVFNKLLAS
jgi:hypothetical protein